MKIYLIQNKSNRKGQMVNKDLAGGFGTATNFGKSIWAKILLFMKGKGVIMPSLTLAYLAAIFKNDGHQLKFTNDYQIITKPVDLIIIISSIVDCHYDLQIARELKRKYPQTKIGFIGTFASLKPDFYQLDSDFIIRGEAESYFFYNKDLSNLRGVIDSSLMEKLDELPFPDWHFFPYHFYSYFPTLYNRPFLPIISSRGCTFSCSHYCPYPLLSGKKWRRRSVVNVIREIEYLIKNFQIKSLLFRDPIFTLDRKYVKDLARQLIDKKIKIEWACETRLDCLDEELIDLLYQSGLRAFNVGIESSNEMVLQNIKRLPIKNELQERLIKYCQRKGINISAFYILGLPTDTKQSIKQTIKYAKYLNTNTAQFTICTPYPGTSFYNEVKDLIFEKDWEKFDAYTPVFKLNNLTSEELLKLKEFAHVSYYFRFRWLLKFILKQIKRWLI